MPTSPFAVQTGRAFDNPDLGFFTELLFMVAYTPTAALDPQLTAAFERSVRSSLQVGGLASCPASV